MAQVPYDHIEAPRSLTLNGVLAFQEGDPVPVETAEREGWLTGDTKVISGTGDTPTEFYDGEIKVSEPDTGTDTGQGETPPSAPAGGPAPAGTPGAEPTPAGTDTGKKGR